MTADRKYSDLLDYIRNLGSVMVAFSGGVDSTFLLKACKEALGSRVKAVTISAPYSPKWEIEEARALADTIGAEHDKRSLCAETARLYVRYYRHCKRRYAV